MGLQLSVDDFPCGCLVTRLDDQIILAANQYFYQECQAEPKPELRLNELLTPASKIVLESYVLPILLNNGHCEEIQLTMQNNQGERFPVLVNARVQHGQDTQVFWVITNAKLRDKLYQELVDLRNTLEIKAERLEYLSETDELTGLLNRRAFIQRSQHLIKQAHRHHQQYSFILLDIDHFKHINDNHGHAVGDQVLKELAQRLKSNCREHDILARIGGEEFALICSHDQQNSAHLFACKLLEQVRCQSIHNLPVTLSIGVATTTELPFESLYKQADQLMYQAKHAGRNQVVSSL